MPQKIITVFGSGTAKTNSKDWKIAFETGQALAEAGFTVANGGYDGAMLASAKGAKSRGGRTIGVTADAFGGPKNEFIDEEKRLPTWQERLFRLIGIGDGFVILNGGTGTLTELVVLWEMLNKKFPSKPVVILGRRMQKAIRSLEQNPEIKIHREFYLSQTPGAAVRYLMKKLGSCC